MADVRITQYPQKIVVADDDIFLIADSNDVDVNGFLKYKKVKAKDLPSIVNTAENITYANLMALKAANGLIISTFYRITDSTSGVSPLLVQAVGVNAISYQAFDGANPLNTINYDVTTDTIRWNLNESLAPLTSVGLSMPSAFSVSNSPLTANGTLAVTGAGVVSQYVRGDGTLASFPSSTGGGASVSYYFNGGTSQGVIGGNTYYEMSKTAVIGVGADFNINANGYVAQFVTDANDPSLLNIPAGNWNFEMWFSASSGGGSPSFYLELYKYDGATLTLISSGSAAPESITGGTAIDLYTTALAVPSTALTTTDRLAVRVFVNHSSRTITLHTQNGHLCQAITTFSTGLTALNGLTNQVQYLTTGTSGTDFGISSTTDTHTFNLPTASASNRGALSSTDWSTFNGKQNAITLTTTGTSGAATLVGATLNIPNYGTALANYLPLAGGTLTGTLNGTTSIMSGVGLNYAFQGLLSAGTGRWNLYMTGTAANHLQGNLLIGGTSLPLNRKISIEGNITGGVTSYGIDQFTTISSDVTTSMFGYRSNPSTAAAAFTLPDLYHFFANDAGIGAGSAITRQYGFYSSIASGTGKWGVYMAGTAANYMNGQLLLGTTTTSAFKLDVNGTANITGKLTVDNNSGISILASTNFGMNMYFDGATGYSYIDNKYDSAGAGRLYIRTRTNGTPVNALMFLGTGEATFTADATINGVKVGEGAGNISSNTAVGFEAINSNVSGTGVTALGYQALKANTGNSNTGIGFQSLLVNSTATQNTAVGLSSLAATTTGGSNTAVGSQALTANISGSNNTALGKSALAANTANANTAVGFEAGNTNTSGTNNIFIGFQVNGTSATDSNKTFIGNSSTTTTTLAGNTTLVGGLALSNSTAPASGIQFPATQVASANNNNLDDYEEGTWTMGVSFGGGTTGITYSTNTGQYTKIGRQVTITGYIVLTSKGTSTGAAVITGLPFTTGTLSSYFSAPSLLLGQTTFLNTYTGVIINSSSSISLKQVTTLGVSSNLTDANFANNSEIIVTLTYFV